MYENIIKKRLNESFTSEDKDQIKSEVIKTLKSSDLKDIISTIVAKELKNNKDLEKEVLTISKHVLSQLIKNLWVKTDTLLSNINAK